MDLHNWSAASISRAPSTRGIWASQNRVRETLWRIKRLELVLWQKTESWGSPWRRAGRLQGNLTIACQYIKSVHKTERKETFHHDQQQHQQEQKIWTKRGQLYIGCKEKKSCLWECGNALDCSCPGKLCMSCPWSVQDWDGCSFEQPELAKDVYTHGSGIGLFHL